LAACHPTKVGPRRKKIEREKRKGNIMGNVDVEEVQCHSGQAGRYEWTTGWRDLFAANINHISYDVKIETFFLLFYWKLDWEMGKACSWVPLSREQRVLVFL